MLNATRITLMFVQSVPALAAIGWAAGRRGDHVLVAVAADQSPRQVKRCILEALTDDEYLSYEGSMSVEEQARRTRLVAGWPHLSRRAAMLAHLDSLDDASYTVYLEGLPPVERERRRAWFLLGKWDSGHPPAALV